MLPSKIRPTMRPFASMSGLPELPPTMSLFVERLNGVAGSSAERTFCHDSGTANGGWPVARSNSRPSRVNGSTAVPFSSQPWTVPGFRRSVNVASGYTFVPNTAKRAFAIASPATSVIASTSSSWRLRSARASGSTSRASTIIGSRDASTAEAPPRQRRSRSAGSPSFEPVTSEAASESGDSVASSFRTMGSSGPSHSRIRSSENDSVSSSSSG